jgi:hypothetical protein
MYYGVAGGVMSRIARLSIGLAPIQWKGRRA